MCTTSKFCEVVGMLYFTLLMSVTNKYRYFTVTCYYNMMFHINIMMLHNIASWCGKEVTESSHRQWSATV